MYPCPLSDCCDSRTPPHRDACRNSWVLVLQSNSSYPVCTNCNASSVNIVRCHVCAGSCAALEKCNVVQDSGSENAECGETEAIYYLNKLTGYSCWFPPEGWNSLVEHEWLGWMLCISEDNYWNQFWSVSSRDAVLFQV